MAAGSIGPALWIVVAGKHDVLDLPLLVAQRVGAGGFRRRHEVRGDDAEQQLAAPQVTAHVVLELVDRQAVLGQHLLGDLGRVMAGDLEGRLLTDGGEQVVLADAIAELRGALGDQGVADQALEHLVLVFLLHVRGNIAVVLLLQLRLLLQPGVARRIERDRLAIRLGRIARGAEVQVDDAVGAPGGEDERERTQDAVPQPLVRLDGIGDFLQHDGSAVPAAGAMRAPPGTAARKQNGGADGSRSALLSQSK